MDYESEYFGHEFVIDGEVKGKSGKKFEDYMIEEHLYFLGFSVNEDDSKDGD